MRKILSKFLAVSLILVSTPIMPVNAGAKELSRVSQEAGCLNSVINNKKANIADFKDDIICKDLLSGKTDGFEVTDNGLAITFHSKTNPSDKPEAWFAPCIAGFTGTDDKVSGEGYTEYVMVRADKWGWGPADVGDSGVWAAAGYEMADYCEDGWFDTWIADNQAGLDYKVQAVKKDGMVYIEFAAGKMKTLTSFPYNKETPFYIALTGQECVLSNIQEAEYSNIVPEEPEGTTIFKNFRAKHLDGEKITKDGITLTFQAKTNGTVNWNTPAYVVFSSNDGKVAGEEYSEYGVMRSDVFGWSGDGGRAKVWQAQGNPSWEEWFNGQKDFTNYTVEAYKSGIYVYVKVTAGSLVEYGKFVVSPDKDTYLSLTGEKCTVKDYGCDNTKGKFIVENEPDDPVADQTILSCPSFLNAVSNGYEVTKNGTSVTFDSNSYDETDKPGDSAHWADANWHTPALIVYTVKDEPSKHNIHQTELANMTGYSELVYLRADNWGWCPEGTKTEAGWSSAGYSWESRGVPSDWAGFLNANKEGVTGCLASAVIEDGKVVVKFSVNGLTEYVTIPYTGTDKVYFSLTGERCDLTNIRQKEYSPIEIPGQLASYPIIVPTPAPTPVPTPAPTLPTADDEDSEGIELECGAFWTAWTLGTEVTESGTAVTFKNTTNSSAKDNWNSPGVVVYSASEAKVNGGNYKEYAYIRADNWAWGPSGVGDKDTPSWFSSGYSMTNNMDSSFEWASWQAANKAGSDCKVQAVKTDGKVIIETTVAGLTTVTTFPVSDGEKIYISLSGEQCKLTNIKTVHYTGIAGITANPSATPAPSAEPSASPAPSATAEPGSTETPGTTEPTAAPGDKDPGTTDPGTSNPDKDNSNEDDKKDNETKKTMKVSDITAKSGKKKVTGNLSVNGTKVTVKVGSKKYKSAKVTGKKFTFTASSKLKKGTKITVKVTKKNYKTVTKTIKVK